MSDTESLEQLALLLQKIDGYRSEIILWLGASVFGILVASCFYGANLVQLYIYATSQRRDPLWVIILVAFIWALDTAHTGFIWSWLYDKTVLDAADISRTLLVFDMTDALSFSVVFSGFIGASVQSFYAYRLCRLAGHPWWSMVSWVGSLARAGLSVAVAILGRRAGTLGAFVTRYKWDIHAILGTSVAVDVFNTVAVCVLLARQRDGMELTTTMISKLTLWTVETGFITSAVALTMEGLLLANKPSVVPALLHVYAKLFAFSFLVTLNGRERLRQAIYHPSSIVSGLSPTRPAVVSITQQKRETKEPAFELVGRSFRSGLRSPSSEHDRKDSFGYDTESGIGIAHGDPESSSLKAVAPWSDSRYSLERPANVVRLHPNPQPQSQRPSRNRI